MKDKKRFFVPEIMLGLGCLGIGENIFLLFNYRTIMENDWFLIFRPGNIGAQTSIILIGVGLLGLLIWLFGLINANNRSLQKTGIILVLVFVLGLIVISFLSVGL